MFIEFSIIKNLLSVVINVRQSFLFLFKIALYIILIHCINQFNYSSFILKLLSLFEYHC